MSDEPEVSKVYVGLRPLYARGSYWQAEALAGGRFTIRIFNPDRSVFDTFENLTAQQRQDMAQDFQGCGLPEGPPATP